MKRVLAAVLALAVVAGGTLTGCGEKEKTGKKDEKMSAAFICANLGDKSFNDIAWEGFKKAETELGMDIKVVEYGAEKSKMEPALVDVAEKYDIVAFEGGEFTEILEKHYEEFPDTKFVGFDIDPTYQVKMPNYFAINYMQNQGDYLAGALAAKMSQTGVIGFVGGAEVVVINDFLLGYVEGAQHADANVKVATAYIGDFVNSPKAKELTQVQMTQGADVLHQVAGAAGLGLFEACAEKTGIWAIGVDADQREYFAESNQKVADVILTSMLKRNDIAIFNILKETAEGKAQYGTLKRWGVKEGVTVIVKNDFYRQNVPQETQVYIDELEGQIAAGEITMDTAYGMQQEQFISIRESVKP
ncbi:BMP family ABC transporter substrate-binding protein [Neobittarella massiliensis]|uniref:BMP family ABC transporter substrate-binding protein n=1 Tax=Neobittarella massiliensis (ex Bilen et al. 2018) TaxID=2041842 RepID=UPI000CF5E5F4|nr:BMP family ABC transporter substrate-binding protein [Neobittarella massiliensis]